jgi:guanine deaminase
MSDAFMTRAIELSIENARSRGGGPFGCVIVQSGGIVSEGVNQVTAANDPTAHAEILAIRQACRKLGRFELTGCEVYTSCEPCPMCLSAIYWARLDRVYFASFATDAAKAGFDDSAIYTEITKPPSERKLPMIQSMSDEALVAFRVWKETPGKILY